MGIPKGIKKLATEPEAVHPARYGLFGASASSRAAMLLLAAAGTRGCGG